MARIIHVETWQAFRDKLLNFSQLDRSRRNDWWFRGQDNASHELVASIDRDQQYQDDDERELYIKDLLSEFRREIIALGKGDPVLPDDAFELLARHHGLPSPLIDWTRSPWIACFFAFNTTEPVKNGRVAVYGLDNKRIPSNIRDRQGTHGQEQIELIDKPEILNFNHRAIHQRGVFLRHSTSSQSLESMLSPALTKFTLPAAEKDLALGDLDQMLLNETRLMYDPDGAAKTASRRLHRIQA